MTATEFLLELEAAELDEVKHGATVLYLRRTLDLPQRIGSEFSILWPQLGERYTCESIQLTPDPADRRPDVKRHNVVALFARKPKA